MSGERDPRAHWLDDDPFDKRTPPSSHSAARDDGNWRQPHIRVVHATGSGAPFVRIFGVEEQARPIPVHTGSIWHFSKIEINHLVQATLAFSLALAFMSVGGIIGALSNTTLFFVGGILYAIAIAPAFLVHETAHKVVARKYGCWAEFRASPGGLRFGIFIAALTGIVFMAPGAVMVAGNTSRSQFGKIALAGPVSNVALWVLGLCAILLGGAESVLGELILVPWLWGNAVLGLFNMLPFGPLDGKKIRTWSIPVFWIWFIICASLVWFNLTQLDSLLGL
ncbi:MAG: M50 family metallopeptidase [Candidatus Thalassarchaeaceae archaeon]|nr:M50 family metallopeptidase [Candidatus Thalassarchaeaceae archaeon]